MYDAGYLRTLIITGCFMLVLGMFMTSLGKEYWQILLSQGVFMGIGLGCLFTPSVGIIATYFTRRRGLAMAIASSGTTIGGIIYPITFSQLINKLHFGWTIRVLAFIMLVTCLPPVLGMRQRVKPPAVRRLFIASALREPEFTLYALATFVGYSGLYIPYFYIQLFCIEKGIITGSLNFYLLPIINAACFFGRIFFGALADKIGPLNGYGIASGGCSVLLFGWMGLHSQAGVLIFCILYGFFSAGLTTLAPNVITQVLVPDMRQFGPRFTMQVVPAAIGLLVGNPIAGALLPKGWLALEGFAAAAVSVCTILTVAARIARVGWGLGRAI